ncbi:hypothetical protein Bca101_015051 [Brassica carinata]
MWISEKIEKDIWESKSGYKSNNVTQNAFESILLGRDVGSNGETRMRFEESSGYLPRTSRARTQRHATPETPPKPSKRSPLPSPNLQRWVGFTTTPDLESQNLQGSQACHHIIPYGNSGPGKANKNHKQTPSRLMTILRTDSPSASFENQRDETKLKGPNSGVDRAGINT